MSTKSHPDLTAAVIHYQTPELLERCLAKLREAAPGARLLVVDTGESRPLTANWEATHPDVQLLREPNHSFAAAVNSALRECRSARFTHLNADVLVEPHTFDELERALTESGAAMAGPLARDGKGRLQRNGVPYRWHQWRAQRSRGWHYAPWLSGCLQYLRSDVIDKVGGMDTTLRFYNEDLEWCLRLRSSGERSVLVATEVVHLGGSSTPASAEPLIEGLRGGYLITRRYHGPLARAVHRYSVLAATSILALIDRSPVRRRAYSTVAKMFRRGEFEESPFGDSLSQENVAFLAGGEA